jgi:transcriptional regulator with XRE-family HTH domain
MSAEWLDALPTGARLARARREAALSQKALAETLGTSLFTIEQMEQGQREFEPFSSAVARATGRPVSALMGASASQGAEVSLPSAPAGARSVASDRHRLVLIAIVLLVTVRLVTEVVPVLPRAANFIDIPIFLCAAGLAAVTPRPPAGRWYVRTGPLAGVFLVLALLSAVVNVERVETGPVLVFLYGFLAPLAMYAITYRVWPPGNAATLSRTLVGLGLLQLAVVAVVNLPTFVSTRNPDDISGTFGTNAYQLVYVLLVLVALVVGIATFEPSTRVARFAIPLVAAFVVVMLLAQYRALLFSTVIAVLAVAYLLKGRVRGVLAVAATGLLFSAAFYYVATSMPYLKLESAARSMAATPDQYVEGRVGVVGHVLDMYEDLPVTAVSGSGPGTYSSRAWQTFAAAGSGSPSNVAGAYARALTGGRIYSTDVSEKYVRPQRGSQSVEGSHAVSNPYSSYASLLAEVGLVGAALIVAIYLTGLTRLWRMGRLVVRRRTPGDPLPALVLATFVAFLTILQMALLENWFEVSRVTFMIWILFAVCCRELDAREQA